MPALAYIRYCYYLALSFDHLGRLYKHSFMKSTIRVELGTLNKPIIRLQVRPSDDVRDQLACQFLHGLEQTSNLCYVNIRCWDDTELRSNHTLDIYPIPADPTEYIRQLSIEQCSTLIDVLISDERRHSLPVSGENKVQDNTLPSRYQVDDLVSTEDIFDGQIVGIRFTIGKVYYDILDKLSGKVIRDVDSACITEPVTRDQVPQPA